MEFKRAKQGEITLLEISGEFDATTAPEVRPQMDAVADEKPKQVILDLAKLRLIDSSSRSSSACARTADTSRCAG